MEEFKNYIGQTVDLDDMNIYSEELREMDIHDLFFKCMADAGGSLFYMTYLHPCFGGGEQEERVKIFCLELSDMWNNKREFDTNADMCTLINEDECRLLLLKWDYRFTDEVENQC